MLRSSLARSLRTVGASVAQPSLPASKVALPRTLPCVASRLTTARFLQTTAVARGSGSSDGELSSRLEQEIKYERESATAGTEGADEPEFVKDFKAAGVWRIQDVAGSDEIALTREYGNEHIRVLFSIGDIDTTENEFEEEGNEEDQEASFPVRCAITISKVSLGSHVKMMRKGPMSVHGITCMNVIIASVRNRPVLHILADTRTPNSHRYPTPQGGQRRAYAGCTSRGRRVHCGKHQLLQGCQARH